MAEITAPSPPRPTPRGMRVMNRLPMLLLKSPAHGIVSRKLLLLTFTGRKSGKRHTLPVGYAREGDTVLIGAAGPWWKNLSGGARVTVLLRGRERTGSAEVVTNQAEMAPLYRTLLAQNPTHGRFVSIRREPDGMPNADDLARAVGRGVAVVRIRLD
ncbi:MAG: nitroreductase family deazaflavin-dependent oxidoreductase [Chloroflexota bacterium]|nr:nitroreductase family deazaflavin-dependent oxidoreductase [Chloroflexota bacterium]